MCIKDKMCFIKNYFKIFLLVMCFIKNYFKIFLLESICIYYEDEKINKKKQKKTKDIRVRGTIFFYYSS